MKSENCSRDEVPGQNEIQTIHKNDSRKALLL